MELLFGPLPGGVFVIGDAGDAVIVPHLFEKAGAVAFAVEDQYETTKTGIGLKFFVAGLGWHFLEQTRNDIFFQSLDQSRINRFIDEEKGLAGAVVDPVVGAPAQAQPLPGNVAAGQLVFVSVIDPHMAVDVERAHPFRIVFHPLAAQLGGPFLSSILPGQIVDLRPQAAHFGHPVQPHKFAQFPGGRGHAVARQSGCGTSP